MVDQESNIREAIRRRRSRIEQIERILSGPMCDRGGRHSLRLIEEKQYHEMAVAELEQTLGLLLPPVAITKEAPAPMVDRRAFCREVKAEIRRVKSLYVQNGFSVAEIHKKYPDWSVWRVLEGLSEEERELFHHPKQWGHVAGYALGLLGKYYGKSPTTIRDWCKTARLPGEIVIRKA